MKRIDDKDAEKKVFDKDKFLSGLSLTISIVAYPATCIVWLGISLSILSLALGIVHNYYFKGNGIVRATFFLSSIYLVGVILFLIISGIYRSILHI